MNGLYYIIPPEVYIYMFELKMDGDHIRDISLSELLVEVQSESPSSEFEAFSESSSESSSESYSEPPPSSRKVGCWSCFKNPNMYNQSSSGKRGTADVSSARNPPNMVTQTVRCRVLCKQPGRRHQRTLFVGATTATAERLPMFWRPVLLEVLAEYQQTECNL